MRSIISPVPLSGNRPATVPLAARSTAPEAKGFWASSLEVRPVRIRIQNAGFSTKKKKVPAAPAIDSSIWTACFQWPVIFHGLEHIAALPNPPDLDTSLVRGMYVKWSGVVIFHLDGWALPSRQPTMRRVPIQAIRLLPTSSLNHPLRYLLGAHSP